MNIGSANLASTIPFNANKLDDPLERAGIDILVPTSSTMSATSMPRQKKAMRGSKQLPHFDFLAHDTGLVSHEAPRSRPKN